MKEYKTLVPYYKKWKWNYLLGLLFLVLTNAGQIYIPQIIKGIINSFQEQSYTLEKVLQQILLMVAIAFVIALCRFGWRYFIQGASRRIEQDLRDRLFRHLLWLDSRFFGKHKTGDLMARATNDINAIRMATGMAFVAAVDGLFMTMAILAVLFSTAPRVALFTIIPLPVLTAIVLFLGPVIGKRFKEVQESFSEISSTSQEVFSNSRIIKSYNREEYFADLFEQKNHRYKRANMQLVKIWGLFFPVLSFLSGLTTFFLLWIGGSAVINGNMTPGDFTAFLSYLAMLIWPMMGAGWVVNILQRGAASLGRINAILHAKPSIGSPKEGKESVKDYSLRIEGLSFKYPESEENVLKDINFEVPSGKILGILGPTGCGKSTLLNLLPRLLDPPPNTVFLDDVPIETYKLPTLRRQFGFVPQESFLFSTTIKENIQYSAADKSEEKFKEVTDLSTIDRDVETFPKKWETMVGEKGVTLSGGQKQRAAISRALLVNPPILVFDDALSAVDTETEALILDHLMEKRKGKTTILVSHRVSTLKNTDHILVLEEGRITQEGTHQELIAQPGYYETIAQLQREGKHHEN